MTQFLIGTILGLIVGVVIGAKVAPPEITNHIDKIKGNYGDVDIDQDNEGITPKKGLIKRIFTRKNKKI